jgi:hypothetical protein
MGYPEMFVRLVALIVVLSIVVMLTDRWRWFP